MALIFFKEILIRPENSQAAAGSASSFSRDNDAIKFTIPEQALLLLPRTGMFNSLWALNIQHPPSHRSTKKLNTKNSIQRRLFPFALLDWEKEKKKKEVFWCILLSLKFNYVPLSKEVYLSLSLSLISSFLALSLSLFLSLSSLPFSVSLRAFTNPQHLLVSYLSASPYLTLFFTFSASLSFSVFLFFS